MPPFARLPDSKTTELGIPHPGEFGCDVPTRLQMQPCSSHEVLDRSDRFFDPAGPFAEACLNVEKEKIAELARGRRKSTRPPGKRHPVQTAQIGNQGMTSSLA